MTALTPADLDALVTLFTDSSWTDLHLKTGDGELFLSKREGAIVPGGAAAPAPATVSPVAAPVAAPAAAPGPATAPAAAALPDNCVYVRSPSLGTFYRAPKPGAAVFCDVGQQVEAESELCLVEVMKLFTSVRAGAGGRVRQILVADGDMVEFDQPLFVIERNG